MTEHIRQKRKGQTLAEFALTLPLLLLLIFGVVEFGRMFQAWVTIQNAAREAARYTTTGQFNEERYSLTSNVYCDIEDVPSTTAPSPQNGGIAISGDGFSGENLYATFYDNSDCFPGPESDQLRRDIMRLTSIYEVARRGAAGLSLEDTFVDGSDAAMYQQLAANWTNPKPRSENPGFFEVTVCSERGFLDENSEPFDENFPTQRFVMIDSIDDLPAGYPHEFQTPFCMLNEVKQSSGNPASDSNHSYPWLDAGGPGDRVTVVVTFNHPLITPLPFTDFLTIRARRSGVNETFTTSRALNAISSGALQTGVQPPRETPVPTSTLTPSHTPITPPTDEPPDDDPDDPIDETSTPEPFTCDRIEVSDINFFRNTVYFVIDNYNYQDAELKWAKLFWEVHPEYPEMFLQVTALDSAGTGGVVNWTGVRRDRPFVMADPAANSESDLTPDEVDFWNLQPRAIPGTSSSGGGFARSFLEARFANVDSIGFSANNPNGLTALDFGSSAISISYPGVPDCNITLPTAAETPPTETPIPDGTPTATWTPDCASENISVAFESFDTFGVVKLRVENRRNRPSPMLGFDLFWFDTDPEPELAGGVKSYVEPIAGNPNALYLDNVFVGTGSAFDSAAVKVWEGPDQYSRTLSTPDNRAEGTWLQNYSLPPNSQRFIFLDFGGTSGRLNQTYLMGEWMFAGSFWFDCTLPDGSSGSGGGTPPDGLVPFDAPPPPPPTNTPVDTPTPGPSDTPTYTFTPAPPTETPLPSNTPTITWTPTPITPTQTPLVLPPDYTPPTQEGGGGGGG